MIHLQSAMKNLPNDPDVQYHYAVGLIKTNRAAEGRTILQGLVNSRVEFDTQEDAKKLLTTRVQG